MDAGEPPERMGSPPESSDPRDRTDVERAGVGQEKGATILVVEREVIVRLAVADFLRTCGYRVFEAMDAAEARTIMTSEQAVAIAVVDVNLGSDMNGFELAKWIREQRPGLRIILTAGAWKMVETAHDLCDGPLLKKPYSHAELVERIRRLLGGLGPIR